MFNLAYAATYPLLDKIKANILQPVITLLFALAAVYFLYGVYETIIGAGSDEARAKGRLHMLWGVIGIFIAVSANGIIHVICKTIGVTC